MANERKFHKFPPIKRQAYLDALRRGCRHTEAAKAVGLHYDTITDYRKLHPEFEDEIARAELEACDPVEAVLFEKAKSGFFPAIVFWLLNRSQGRWTDKRNPAVIAATPVEKEQSAEEIAKELKAMLDKEGGR